MATTFWTDNLTYITNVCHAYVGENVQAVAQMAIPWATTALGIYVLVWCFAALIGSIDELFMDMVKRVLTLACILGVGLSVANQNMLITETFLNGPDQFIAGMARAPTTGGVVGALDIIWDQGFKAGANCWAKAGVLKGDFGMYLVAGAIFITTIAVTAYAFALIALSKVMVSIVVVLCSLFVLTIMFRATSNFFSSWIQQLSNYFLVPVLVVAINLLIMTLFSRAADKAAGIEGAASIDQLFPFLAMGGVSLMALGSVLTVSSGLAGGVSLSSFGIGRMASSMASRMIFTHGRKAAVRVGQAGLKVVGAAARPAWKAYQNRNKNSIRKP